MKTIEIKKLGTTNIGGLGQVSVLFYGDAKKNGINHGDSINVNGSLFDVKEYIACDALGNKVSGFRLSEQTEDNNSSNDAYWADKMDDVKKARKSRRAARKAARKIA